jgi:oligopeptide transport system substrate-binding protein
MSRRILPAVLLLVCHSACADTLRRGLGPEPDSLDIHEAQGLSAIHLLRETREGLMTFDARGELAPGVAASWEVLDQGRLFRFRLRGEARWSNGDPLVADDFVRAWQAAVTPASAARTAALLGPVQNARAILEGRLDPAALGIRAVATHELEIRLQQAAPWFTEILAHPVSFPLHPGAATNPRDAPVNGAFQVVEAVPHAMIRLAANPLYHAADSVRLAAVEYLPIEDPAAELARYRAGELDITETIPAGRYDWLRGNLAAELHVHPYLGSFWLGFNLAREPFRENPDLRRALALAVDRETLVRVVLGAGELPAWSIVPPGLPGYQPRADNAAGLDRDSREAKARQLYRAAGYGKGRELLVELRFNTSSLHRRMAVAVAAMWKQVLGVGTELINEEWKVFVNNRRQGVITQVFRGGWIADFADPESFLDLFRSGNELNTTFYANTRYDALLDQAGLLQGARRMAALQQAELALMRDMPVIPLYYYVSRHLVKPGVRGFEDNVRDIHLSRYLSLDRDTR